MNPLSQKRCSNHAGREAVARCPECLRYFCRECITEHEDKVLCAECLKAQAGEQGRRKRGIPGIRTLMPLTVGLSLLWVIFYYIGQILLALPSSFHEGTLWKSFW